MRDDVKNFIDMLECDEDRDQFFDDVAEAYPDLAEQGEEEAFFRWVSEEVNEVMDREDADERTITGELGENQKQTLREMGWEI